MSHIKFTKNLSAFLFFFLLLFTSDAFAHCQVPCGIYDDAARIATLKEDAKTIAKAVNEIKSLEGKTDSQSINQATRWVMNKEKHASNIIDLVANYFLAQRVKPGENENSYKSSLADHHAVIIAAMKAKQHSNKASVEALEKSIDTLTKHYK